MADANDILRSNLEHTIFSWSKQSGLNPVNVSHAKGVHFWDRSGKRYIDFSSQLVNVNTGHGHPKVTEAVTKQMQEVSYIYPGMVTEARGKLGETLARITPGTLNRTFFTLGGAESIENAIKIARLVTGRHKIVTNYRSYHGATYGAISASGDPRRFPVDGSLMPGIVHVENPYYYRCPWGTNSPEACGEMAIQNLERVLQYENPADVAAILMEGESGTSGCIKYPPMYLAKVKAVAEKYGILFIADEVMSGFGRTGKWWGVDHHGITPDMICMAKGLTSGYIPLGGVVVTEAIAQHFDNRPLPAGLTYSAHPVACAAANAVIEIYESEGMIENAARMGRYIEQRVKEMAAQHPSIGDFRNTGLLGAIELVRNRESKKPLVPWNANAADNEPSNRIAARLRELGMFTFVRWNWIFTAPPLCITEAEMEEGLGIISDALSIADELYEA